MQGAPQTLGGAAQREGCQKLGRMVPVGRQNSGSLAERASPPAPILFPHPSSNPDVIILSEAKVLVGPDPPGGTDYHWQPEHVWDHVCERGWCQSRQKLSPLPQEGAQLTHLSRSTTPSMQAPKRTTLLKSAAVSRKTRSPLSLLHRTHMPLNLALARSLSKGTYS